MFEIRPYAPGDLDALYRICLETGDSGEDATPLYQDHSLIGAIWAAPYGVLEPDFAFVLADAEGVCGYVVGTPDSTDFEAREEREWWPALRQRYPDPPERLTADQRLMHHLHQPSLSDPAVLAEYPAHMHIDLLPRGQGGGNGRRMIEREFQALREAGAPGVHLGVGVRNERAIGFYKHIGMQELGRDGYGVTMVKRL